MKSWLKNENRKTIGSKFRVTSPKKHYNSHFHNHTYESYLNRDISVGSDSRGPSEDYPNYGKEIWDGMGWDWDGGRWRDQDDAQLQSETKEKWKTKKGNWTRLGKRRRKEDVASFLFEAEITPGAMEARIREHITRSEKSTTPRPTLPRLRPSMRGKLGWGRLGWLVCLPLSGGVRGGEERREEERDVR